MKLRAPWTLVLLPALSMAVGCSAPQPGGADRGPAVSEAQKGLPPAPAPPPAPGPSYARSAAIAVPGEPDTRNLDDAQLDAMFDAAVAQARPGEEKRAACVGMQGLADRAVTDAPERTIRRLAELLRLPAVPASQCRADTYPFVIATEAEAILYTVKVESSDRRGVLTFWAIATYGNLGANGAKLRLVREGGRWVSKPTGVTVIS